MADKMSMSLDDIIKMNKREGRGGGGSSGRERGSGRAGGSSRPPGRGRQSNFSRERNNRPAPYTREEREIRIEKHRQAAAIVQICCEEEAEKLRS